MKTNNKTTYNINSDEHLKNIFEGNRYLELGIIDVEIISKLLANEVININKVTFFPIQNKGLGHSTHKDSSIKNNLPFMFYRMLAEGNPDIRLVITYGLYYYRQIDKKDKFAPIIFIPIRMYYENGKTYIQKISKPFENPELYTLIPTLSKQTFTQNESLTDIYSLDSVLKNLEKIKQGSVRIENYLTYVVKKREEIIINKKFFDSKNYEDVTLKKGNYYYSRMLTKNQKEIVDKAIKGENISFSGYAGTGKTTVLKNIIINGLAKKKKMLYISDSLESINDVANFLKENGLYDYCLNMCRINDKSYDNKVEHSGLVDEKLKNVKQIVEEETTTLKEFEKILNSTVSNFKFVDLLKRFFLINSFEDVKNFKLEKPDDFEFIYKSEYQKISNALKLIDENLQKMQTFKNSVWSQIPHLNDIKHSDEVIDLIFDLYDEFKLLREKEIELENYGVKSITSFTMMRRCMVTIEEMFKQSYPSKWKKDINQFNKSKDTYSNLKEDFVKYEDMSQYMSKTYNNLDSIIIEDEIKKLYGSFYTEKDNSTIDDIIANRLQVQNINVTTILESKTFKDVNDKIKGILEFDIVTSDEAIEDFNEMIRIFFNYPIYGKLMSLIINDKDETAIQRLDHIYTSIVSLNKDIDDLINLNPKKNAKLIKIGNEKNPIVQRHSQIKKKITKLEKEYKEISNSNYINHEKVLEAIEVLKIYYKKIKYKDYGKNITDYILSFGIGNRKLNNELLAEYDNAYNKVVSNFGLLKNYGVSCNDLSFRDKLELLNNYNQYIIELFKSNDNVSSVILDNNSIISINTYYRIKEDEQKYNDMINYLRNNKEYKHLYEQFYNGEQTDYNLINRLVLIFNAYVNLFNSAELALSSLKKADKITELAREIVDLNNRIGDNLRLYTSIFKDSVSRYYFSNLEENISHLRVLTENKEELTYYLNVTSGIKVLDKYQLNGFINYIVNNDDVTLLSEKFDYLYYKQIIDKVLKGKQAVIRSNNYLFELEELLDKEDELCNAISQNTINLLLQNVPKQNFNRKNNQPYISKAKITLTKFEYAIEYLKENQFDMVLIDDAHMIHSGGYNGLFKNKQVIICGDHQFNKVANRNLISLVTTNKSYVLRKRVVIGPRMLTYGLPSTTSPFRINYLENRGCSAMQSNVVGYIFDLYTVNKNVKINWYIKEVENQFQAYEDIAFYFYEKGIETKEIIKFINENIHIVDIACNNYIHSDYDIIDLNEYYNEDSEIEARNYLEILKISKYGFVIYDKDDLLNKDNINYSFYNMLKELYQRENIFISTYNDQVSKVVAKLLEDRGYKVVYPSNGINLSVIKKNSDQLVSIIILYSNGFVYDVKSNYRFLKEIYQDEGHKIIFRTMLDLIDGPDEFIDGLCEAIDD